MFEFIMSIPLNAWVIIALILLVCIYLMRGEESDPFEDDGIPKPDDAEIYGRWRSPLAEAIHASEGRVFVGMDLATDRDASVEVTVDDEDNVLKYKELSDER